MGTENKYMSFDGYLTMDLVDRFRFAGNDILEFGYVAGIFDILANKMNDLSDDAKIDIVDSVVSGVYDDSEVLQMVKSTNLNPQKSPQLIILTGYLM